jgi:hypothetical protein
MQVDLTERRQVRRLVFALILHSAGIEAEALQDHIRHEPRQSSVPLAERMDCDDLMLRPGGEVHNLGIPLPSLGFGLALRAAGNEGKADIELPPEGIHPLLYRASRRRLDALQLLDVFPKPPETPRDLGICLGEDGPVQAQDHLQGDGLIAFADLVRERDGFPEAMDLPVFEFRLVPRPAEPLGGHESLCRCALS